MCTAIEEKDKDTRQQRAREEEIKDRCEKIKKRKKT